MLCAFGEWRLVTKRSLEVENTLPQDHEGGQTDFGGKVHT